MSGGAGEAAGDAAEAVRDTVGETVRDTARRGGDAAWLDPAVRFGMVVYGAVHLLVAGVALQLALGDRSEKADSNGALARLADQPAGLVAVWAVALGMGLLVVWRLLDLVAGHSEAEGAQLWSRRAADVFKAGICAALGLSAARVALGAGSSGESTDGLTARLMSLPAGQVMVGAVGLAILGYGAYNLWRGVTGRHADDLGEEGRRGDIGSAYLALGAVGHAARGIAIGIVGVLFCYAAVTAEPKKSGGLDQALRQVLQQPFGPWLLGAVALGVGAFGLFCFAQARHLSR